VRLLAAQAGVAITARELALLDASVALAEERVALGLSAPLELSLLSLNRNQVRVESLARTQAVTLAERALEQALALPADGLAAARSDALFERPHFVAAGPPSQGNRVDQPGDARHANDAGNVRLAGVAGLDADADMGMSSANDAFSEQEIPTVLGTFSAAAEPAPVPEMAPLLDAGLTLRADVLVALARYAEADAGVRQAVAAQYPQITLNPSYFFDQGDHVWSLMTGLTLPLAATHWSRIEAASKLRVQRRA
jgi:hypothetical protein